MDTSRNPMPMVTSAVCLITIGVDLVRDAMRVAAVSEDVGANPDINLILDATRRFKGILDGILSAIGTERKQGSPIMLAAFVELIEKVEVTRIEFERAIKECEGPATNHALVVSKEYENARNLFHILDKAARGFQEFAEESLSGSQTEPL